MTSLHSTDSRLPDTLYIQRISTYSARAGAALICREAPMWPVLAIRALKGCGARVHYFEELMLIVSEVRGVGHTKYSAYQTKARFDANKLSVSTNIKSIRDPTV